MGVQRRWPPRPSDTAPAEGSTLPTTRTDIDQSHAASARQRPIEAQESAAPVARAGAAPASAEPTPGPSGRWWLGVLFGAVVAGPLSWLLSHAATLPFFIGVFFFALFGLVIGASIHRVASGRAPYARAPIIAGTTLIVLQCWGVSLHLESVRFPQDVATFAIEATLDIGDRTADEFRADVAENTRRFLRETYPPGGLVGYARWSLLSSRLTPQNIPGLRRPFRSDQAKVWWAVRVVLSVGLLAFGVGSQTLPLASTRPKAKNVHRDSAPHS